MSNSSKFFENKDCEFYPCHKDMTEINCLFCYCPLFKDKCVSDGRCENCEFPHKPENYDKVVSILKRGK